MYTDKNFIGPMTEWGKITTDFYQRLTQQQLELIEENVSRFSNQLKRFAHVRKPEDFINLQKDCFNEDVTAAIEGMQKWIHTSMENIEEFTKLCGSSLHDHANYAMHGMNSSKSSDKK